MADATDKKPALKTLVTTRGFSADKFRLLELNEEVEKAILAGDSLSIVGGASQRAVLCTASNSFFLAREDTSNLRLLTTHTQWSADSEPTTREIDVLGSAGSHFVLQSKVPDLGQLKTLLLQAPYTKNTGSPGAKRAKLSKLYTTEDLMTELQVSKQEVLTMLAQLCAFEDAGSWRVLDPAYQSSIFGDILDGIIQNDWDFQTQGVLLDELLRAFDEPAVVVRQCCRVYGTIVRDAAGSDRCTFNSSKIAIFCAKQLFKERDDGHFQPQSFGVGDQSWLLDQFLDKWQLRVPDPIKVNGELLRGNALVKTHKGKPSRLVYLAEDELPTDPKQRFDKLFEFQEKWTVAQLEPYISALVRPGVTQASLLLKYSRSSRQGSSDERLYSKR